MAPLAFLNGRLIPYADAGLPWHDAGLVFGATATELIRTFRHRLFRLEDHIKRLRQSCKSCHISLEPTDADLNAAATELVAHNSKLIDANHDLGLVIFATPGPLGRYVGTAADGPPTLAMHTFPIPFGRYRTLFTQGAHLVIPPTRQINENAIPRTAKHRSRMHWWIATQRASAMYSNAEPLLLDDDGFVTETPTANLVVVFGSELVTPSECLPGVSLQVVRELAAAAGLRFTDRRLTPDECEVADELLLTSTVFCVANVSRFCGHARPAPRPVFQRLLTAYIDFVNFDFVSQIIAGS